MSEKKDKNRTVQDLSDDAERWTNNASSQADLPEPRVKKEDLPQADQDRFKDGVYSGTGTGAGPGGSTNTGGADTTTMEGQPRLGTTDKLPNEQTLGSSERDGTNRTK